MEKIIRYGIEINSNQDLKFEKWLNDGISFNKIPSPNTLQEDERKFITLAFIHGISFYDAKTKFTTALHSVCANL